MNTYLFILIVRVGVFFQILKILFKYINSLNSITKKEFIFNFIFKISLFWVKYFTIEKYFSHIKCFLVKYFLMFDLKKVLPKILHVKYFSMVMINKKMMVRWWLW